MDGSSFDRFTKQSAPRASDGIGVKLLLHCPCCQRRWLQDGKAVILDLQEPQLQALARDLAADLENLPAVLCRVCLHRLGGGIVNVDEYGQGRGGFGCCWERPHPPLHAMVTIMAQDWMKRVKRGRRPEESLPQIVTHPEYLSAVLRWFEELPAPTTFRPMDQESARALAADQPPGFGQSGWSWKGALFAAPCPPLQGTALLHLAIARPESEPFFFPVFFPLWQELARLVSAQR